MPLPSTVRGLALEFKNSRIGPFYYDGRVFVITRFHNPQLPSFNVQVQESSDGGETWTNAHPSTISSSPGSPVHGQLIGSNLFVGTYVSTGLRVTRIGLDDGTIQTLIFSGPAIPSDHPTGLPAFYFVARSETEFVFLHQGNPEMIMGTMYGRFAYSIWTPAGWVTTQPTFQNGETGHYYVADAILGADARVHFLAMTVDGSRRRVFTLHASNAIDIGSLPTSFEQSLANPTYGFGLGTYDPLTQRVTAAYTGHNTLNKVMRFNSVNVSGGFWNQTTTTGQAEGNISNPGAYTHTDDGVLWGVVVRSGSAFSALIINDQGSGSSSNWVVERDLAPAEVRVQGVSIGAGPNVIGVAYSPDGETILYDRVLLGPEPVTVGAERVSRWDVEQSVRVPVGANIPAGWNIRATLQEDKQSRWTVRTVTGVVDRQASWSTRVDSGTERIARWSSRLQVGAERSTSWGARILAAVERSASWRVRTLTGALRTASWKIYGHLGVENTSRWSVRGVVGTFRTAAWNVQALLRANGTRLARWHVRASVGTERVSRHSVRSSVGVSGSASWTIQGVAGAERISSWNVRDSASETRETRWNVRSATAAERTASWRVRTPSWAETQSRWNIRGTVAAIRVATWDIGSLVSVGASRVAGWAIRRVAGNSRSTTWNLSAFTGAFREALWDVKDMAPRQPVGASRVARWAVRVPVGESRGVSWSTRVDSGTERLAGWNILISSGKTGSARWNVRVVAGDSRDVTWSTRVDSGVERGAEWHVYGQVGSDATFRWHIRAHVGASRHAMWDLGAIGSVGLSRLSQWNIRAHVSAERVAGWKVYRKTGDERQARWVVDYAVPTFPVGDSRQARWNVYATTGVGTSATVRWAVYGVAGDSRTVLWVVRVPAGDVHYVSWIIRGEAGDDRQTLWHIGGVAGTERIARWGIESLFTPAQSVVSGRVLMEPKRAGRIFLEDQRRRVRGVVMDARRRGRIIFYGRKSDE